MSFLSSQVGATKVCTKCDVEKPLCAYYRIYKDNPNIRESSCKNCRKMVFKAYCARPEVREHKRQYAQQPHRIEARRISIKNYRKAHTVLRQQALDNDPLYREKLNKQHHEYRIRNREAINKQQREYYALRKLEKAVTV